MTELDTARKFEFEVRVRENIAAAVVKFLKCPFTNDQEVRVFDVNAPVNQNAGIMDSAVSFAASYDYDSIPSEHDAFIALSDNDFKFSGSAALDIFDNERIGFFSVPGSLKLSVIAYNDETSEESIMEIVDYLRADLQ